jgi:hypothetical protein
VLGENLPKVTDKLYHTFLDGGDCRVCLWYNTIDLPWVHVTDKVYHIKVVQVQKSISMKQIYRNQVADNIVVTNTAYMYVH